MVHSRMVISPIISSRIIWVGKVFRITLLIRVRKNLLLKSKSTLTKVIRISFGIRERMQISLRITILKCMDRLHWTQMFRVCSTKRAAKCLKLATTSIPDPELQAKRRAVFRKRACPQGVRLK